MKIMSLNVGQPREVSWQGKTTQTGIFKSPVEGPVNVSYLGLDGDGQADMKNHGGLDKAVFAYPYEHYAFWRGELKRDDLTDGIFGENLTTEGALEDEICIGDRFESEVKDGPVFEVSQPRGPCFKLGIRLNDASIVKRYHESLRVGFYLRVIKEGSLKPGDRFRHEGYEGESISVRDLYQLVKHRSGAEDELRRVYCLPALAAAWKREIEKGLKM
jgi:MOSC domain-containing protein YiiM